MVAAATGLQPSRQYDGTSIFVRYCNQPLSTLPARRMRLDSIGLPVLISLHSRKKSLHYLNVESEFRLTQLTKGRQCKEKEASLARHNANAQ